MINPALFNLLSQKPHLNPLNRQRNQNNIFSENLFQQLQSDDDSSQYDSNDFDYGQEYEADSTNAIFNAASLSANKNNQFIQIYNFGDDQWCSFQEKRDKQIKIFLRYFSQLFDKFVEISVSREHSREPFQIPAKQNISRRQPLVVPAIPEYKFNNLPNPNQIDPLLLQQFILNQSLANQNQNINNQPYLYSLELQIEEKIGIKLKIHDEIKNLKKNNNNEVQSMTLSKNKLTAILNIPQQRTQYWNDELNQLTIVHKQFEINDQSKKTDYFHLQEFLDLYPQPKEILIEIQSIRKSKKGRNTHEIFQIYAFSKNASLIEDTYQALEDFYERDYKTQQQLFLDKKYLEKQIVALKYEYLKQHKTIETFLKQQGINEKVIYGGDDYSIQCNVSDNQLLSITDPINKVLNTFQVFKIHIPCDYIFKTKFIFQTLSIYDQLNNNKKIIMKRANDICCNQIQRYKSYNVTADFDTDQSRQEEYFIFGTNVIDSCELIQGYFDSIEIVQINYENFISKTIRDKFKRDINKLSEQYRVNIDLINVIPCHIKVISDQKQLLDRIEEQIRKLLEEYNEQDQQEDKIIELDNDAWVIQRIFETSKDRDFIAKLKKTHEDVDIDFKLTKFVISGQRSKTQLAGKDLQIKLLKLKNMKIEEQFQDKNLLWAYRNIGQRSLEQTYKVKTKIEMRENFNDSSVNESFTTFDLNSSFETQVNYTKLEEKQQSINYQWSYKVFQGDSNYHQRTDQTGDWFDFDYDQNNQIESHFQKCKQLDTYGQKQKIIGDMNMQKNGFEYMIYGYSKDPSQWFEENTQTGKKRQLQRKDVPLHLQRKFGQNNTQSSTLNQKYINKNQAGWNTQRVSTIDRQQNFGLISQIQETLVIEGLQEDIDRLVENLKIYFKDDSNHKEILPLQNFFNQLDKKLTTELDNYLQNKIHKKNYNFNHKEFEIEFIGQKAAQYKLKIIKKLIGLKSLKFPDYWQDKFKIFTTQDSAVYQVDKTSSEFASIQQIFTSQKRVLVDVQRFQDKGKWQMFQNELKYIKQKNGQDPLVTYLFHGTRLNNPQDIIQSQDGLDLRFSKQGYFGKALYFTQNLQYVYDYGFQDQSIIGFRNQGNITVAVNNNLNTRKIIMAKVIIGISFDSGHDSSLTHTPLLPGNTSKRYDSISGNASGTQVYMIYNNRQAYSEYIITFQ
ncbi:poly adp-ribose polymerase member 14-like protein [Stylonychia lemnae]|uniref:Poly [ADP-ribose] polymerase n=1 Tax=Stylonychia lemnae TaxID=5949 RepID=A0A078B3K9_STYLE|nr:poly adp-ribose polymerase member 14-like protein [Stylonychia lemnae]|eukprot:CDW87812.1 poly adp-ribose polymerase member 14-like protein [Stylonychia lemnae]